jgi:hypothetical protein
MVLRLSLSSKSVGLFPSTGCRRVNSSFWKDRVLRTRADVCHSATVAEPFVIPYVTRRPLISSAEQAVENPIDGHPEERQATKDLCSSLKLQLRRFFASLRMTRFKGLSAVIEVTATTAAESVAQCEGSG